MIRITAQAVTGKTGKAIVGRHGFDPSDIFVDAMGNETTCPWQREVSLEHTDTLENVTNPDIPKYSKYDLLGWRLMTDEDYSPETVVEMYSSGKIKEMRVCKSPENKFKKTRKYRMIGKVYYGEKKA